MIHNLRRKDGSIYPLDVEIGSGIRDKNGNEIFEGDKVKIGSGIYYVEFRFGVFVACDNAGNAIYPLRELDNNLEVIGHSEG